MEWFVGLIFVLGCIAILAWVVRGLVWVGDYLGDLKREASNTKWQCCENTDKLKSHHKRLEWLEGTVKLHEKRLED